MDDVPRSPEDTDAKAVVKPPYSPEFETAQSWRKDPPKAGPAPELHLPVPKTFALANGLKVYLVEEHTLPVVSAALVDLAGSEENPADKPGLSAFTARMLSEGTNGRSAVELADGIDSIGAELRTNASVDQAAASIGALSNNTDAAMALLSDVSLHPAFLPEEVERIRKQRLVAIQQEADQPVATVLRVGQKTLYGSYSYGYRDIGTTASVKTITRDDCNNSGAAIMPRQTRPCSWLETLPRRKRSGWRKRTLVAGLRAALQNRRRPPTPAPPTRKIVIVDKPGAPQTALIAFGLGARRATPDYPALNVMNSVLGTLLQPHQHEPEGEDRYT